jgi:hypothetical protein
VARVLGQKYGRHPRQGWTWPGFEYSDTEWQRLRQLAGTIGAEASASYQCVNAMIFMAAIGIVIGALVGLLALLRVDSASVPAWVFAAALPGIVFVMLGFILPVAMRLAGLLMAKGLHNQIADVPASPVDTILADKIGHQFRRVALFAAVVVLAFVLSDAYVPPPLASWMPVIIAGCAGLYAILLL